MTVHHMVIVDGVGAALLDGWAGMLADFRADRADATVSVLSVDETGVRKLLAATSVRSAPASLTVPTLGGTAPNQVPRQLLEAVIDVRVQLGDPEIVIHMLTAHGRDIEMMKDVRAEIDVRILRAMPKPRRLRAPRFGLSGWTAIAASAAVVGVMIFHDPTNTSKAPISADSDSATSSPSSSSPTQPPAVFGKAAPVGSGWTVYAIRAVPVGRCVTQYPYASRLNSQSLEVVSCEADNARMRFVGRIFASAQPDTCPFQGVRYGWDDGGDKYCFTALLKPGMCVPAVWKDGGYNAYFGIPADCRDPIDSPKRMTPEEAAGQRLLRIEWSGPNGTSPSCSGLFYEIETVDTGVCAHLFE